VGPQARLDAVYFTERMVAFLCSHGAVTENRGRLVTYDHEGRKLGYTPPLSVPHELGNQIHHSYSSVVLQDRFMAVISPSQRTHVAYGGSMSPAALECVIYNADCAEVASYEIPSANSLFSTFRACMDTRSDPPRLAVSVWDDEGVQVVELLTGRPLFITATDVRLSTAHALVCTPSHIAAGREWQRFAKDAPLRIYDGRAAGVAQGAGAKGDSVVSVAVNATETMLASASKNGAHITVWRLPELTKLCDLSLGATAAGIQPNLVGFVGPSSVAAAAHDARGCGAFLARWELADDTERNGSPSSTSTSIAPSASSSSAIGEFWGGCGCTTRAG
jgi:hypothetical protein